MTPDEITNQIDRARKAGDDWRVTDKPYAWISSGAAQAEALWEIALQLSQLNEHLSNCRMMITEGNVSTELRITHVPQQTKGKTA